MMCRYYLSVLGLLVLASCAPSATAPPEDIVIANPQYSGNFSTLYELSTVSSGIGLDWKWKDSLGALQTLSGLQHKVVIITFWKPSYASQLDTLNAVATDLGDSVRVLAIETGSLFSYVTQTAPREPAIQYIVDTADLIEPRISSQHGDQTYYKLETFILAPNGGFANKVETNGEIVGLATKDQLEADVRAAYK